ncbi:penicillin-binding protein 2 [Sesbania bispinosa]|nr:penicillin-binding protein 2 [Sesbania bispinosa]
MIGGEGREDHHFGPIKDGVYHVEGLSCIQVDDEGLDVQLGPIGVNNWYVYLDQPAADVTCIIGTTELNTQSELLGGGQATPIFTACGSGKSGRVQLLLGDNEQRVGDGPNCEARIVTMGASSENEEQLCNVPILVADDSYLLCAKFQEQHPKKRRGRSKKGTKANGKVSSSNVETIQTILSLDLEPGEIAERVWDIGKVLGVSHPSTGSAILNSLLELEKRDRETIGRFVGRN